MSIPKFTVTNAALFYKKLVTLSVATVALIPLIHFKLSVPASLYLSILLALHLYIMYVYFAGVPWRALIQNKKELLIRLAAIGFFVYLLTVLSFVGSPAAILLNLAGAFMLHVIILMLMMASRVQQTKTAQE
jgi:hypothetical protein